MIMLVLRAQFKILYSTFMCLSTEITPRKCSDIFLYFKASSNLNQNLSSLKCKAIMVQMFKN